MEAAFANYGRVTILTSQKMAEKKYADRKRSKTLTRRFRRASATESLLGLEGTRLSQWNNPAEPRAFAKLNRPLEG